MMNWNPYAYHYSLPQDSNFEQWEDQWDDWDEDDNVMRHSDELSPNLPPAADNVPMTQIPLTSPPHTSPMSTMPYPCGCYHPMIQPVPAMTGSGAIPLMSSPMPAVSPTAMGNENAPFVQPMFNVGNFPGYGPSPFTHNVPPQMIGHNCFPCQM